MDVCMDGWMYGKALRSDAHCDKGCRLRLKLQQATKSFIFRLCGKNFKKVWDSIQWVATGETSTKKKKKKKKRKKGKKESGALSRLHPVFRSI
jgi:hypothetical protein